MLAVAARCPRRDPDGSRRHRPLRPPYCLRMTKDTGSTAPFDVLLLGGASGTGKSSIVRELASRLGMGLTPLDDIQIVLERMADPQRFPVLHEWRLHPDRVLALDDEGMLLHTQEYAGVMAQALEPVIAEHLRSSTPVLFEGDFILPSFAAMPSFEEVPTTGRVRALFLFETEDQLAKNFRMREGVDQARRAQISSNYGRWLREECDRLGMAAIQARPWETLVDRALAAVSSGRPGR
jgi:2-phosphoglycerate kinase